jgi:hypothetical protein
MPRLMIKTALTLAVAAAFTASPLLAATADAGNPGRKKGSSGMMRLGGPAQNGNSARPMRLGGPQTETLAFRVPGQGNGSGCQFCSNDSIRAFYFERDRNGTGSQ